MEKTYKREVAGVMLAYLGVMWAAALWHEPALEAAKFLSLPIFGWAGAAFALDWKHKQASH